MLEQAQTEKQQLELVIKEKEQLIELMEITQSQKLAQEKEQAKNEMATMKAQHEETIKEMQRLAKYVSGSLDRVVARMGILPWAFCRWLQTINIFIFCLQTAS